MTTTSQGLPLENAKSQELLEAAKPLIKFLNENYHPHAIAIVDTSRVEIYEGSLVNSTEEYCNDGDVKV